MLKSDSEEALAAGWRRQQSPSLVLVGAIVALRSSEPEEPIFQQQEDHIHTHLSRIKQLFIF